MGEIVIRVGWLRRLAFACAIGAAFIVAGCQSLPRHGLTPEQIRVLKEQGFSETDEGWTLDQSAAVLFAFKEATLSTEGERNVVRLGKVLLSIRVTHLKVVGYTDSLGDSLYNDELSKRRADVVADALADGGFPRGGLEPIGMGARHPIADNRTREGRAQNRHVAIIVVVD